MVALAAVTLVLSLVLTPMVRRWAIGRGWVDVPGEERRLHKVAVPRLGGIAMFAAFTVGVLFTFVFSDLRRGKVGNEQFEVTRVLLMLVGAGIITAVMAVDDVRGLKPMPRLLWQIGAALLVVVPSLIWPGGANDTDPDPATVHYDQGAGVLVTAVQNPFGGTFDLLVQRVIDVWLAFPGLVFVIFVIAIFGRSTPALVLTLGLMVSAGSSRILRSATIAEKEAQYIEASRAIGSTHLRVLFRHILPNVFPVIVIAASVQIGSVILIESSLSYLGFGTPPPFPSWGRMLQESQTNSIYQPTLALFPGLAITIVVFGFNMFGDALRDVLDPRLRVR